MYNKLIERNFERKIIAPFNVYIIIKRNIERVQIGIVQYVSILYI